MTTAGAPPSTGELVLHPLSLQQEFLCLFDRGDEAGPFGPRYHVVDGWRLTGHVDVPALRAALADVVERHESLRTEVVRGDGARGQVVHPPSEPVLTTHDLPGVPAEQRAHRAEEFMNDIEAGVFELGRRPLLRAALGRFDDQDAVLVLNSHHAAVDAWSMQVIMRDVAVFYARRTGHAVADLPPVEQYREHAVRQRTSADTPEVRARRAYWGRKLAGAELLTVAVDRKPDPHERPVTSWRRFAYDAATRAAVERTARAHRATPFMVLTAAFAVHCLRTTGVADVVVPTFTPGREDARTHDSVGSYFNFVPLRVDLRDCASFSDALARARTTCLESYANELPLSLVLGEAPGLMASTAREGQVPFVFQVVQSPFTMERERVGGLEYTSIWDRRMSQEIGSEAPDGMIWSFHFGPSDDIAGLLGYSRHLFTEATVTRAITGFGAALEELSTRPDTPVR